MHLATLLLLAAPLEAQQTIQPLQPLTPRELFYVPLASAPAPKKPYKGPPPHGLRYGILKRTAEDWKEVPPASVFHSGDLIRVRITSNEAGYLYIAQSGTSGKWTVLFPAAAINNGENRID